MASFFLHTSFSTIPRDKLYYQYADTECEKEGVAGEELLGGKKYLEES